MGQIHLDYRRDTQNINYRGDVRGAYEQVAQQFGVQVAFDVELPARQAQLQLQNVDFLTAMDVLGQATRTFWQPLTKRLFFVAQDTTEKRRDYESLIVRTIPLPASETTEEMQELFRLVREVTGVTRASWTNSTPRSRSAVPRALWRSPATWWRTWKSLWANSCWRSRFSRWTATTPGRLESLRRKQHSVLDRQPATFGSEYADRTRQRA